MNKIKTLMLNHPLVSTLLILPFSLVVVFAVLDLIINVLIPFLFALWLTGWIFGTLVGVSMSRSVYEPFWFVRSQRL
tara:strand:+ start:499 stop:729 length:231 start_codon:yes stop_codon:yes gene_type:complete